MFYNALTVLQLNIPEFAYFTDVQDQLLQAVLPKHKHSEGTYFKRIFIKLSFTALVMTDSPPITLIL